MRNLIVKLFALNYIVALFGKSISFPRAANMIVPVMCLAATWTNLVTLLLLALVVFIPFVYLRFFPAQYNELDRDQKLQYKNIKGKHADLYKGNVKFKNLHLLLINPVIIIITIIIFLL